MRDFFDWMKLLAFRVSGLRLESLCRVGFGLHVDSYRLSPRDFSPGCSILEVLGCDR